jgi:UDP-N-acetylglucosamine diphosphorylase/glucosamine-1-phosphate N-acetyltransferase
MSNEIACIILAAGLGTRMKSNKAKVLHQLLDKPMILYVVETANQVAGKNVIVVVGHQAEKVKQVVGDRFQVNFALQKEQLGTGHAVMCALDMIPVDVEDVLITCGDVPLLTYETLSALLKYHQDQKRDISVLAVKVDNPTGYGRILMDQNGHFTGIVEEADANAKEKTIPLINSGIYCIKKMFLSNNLNRIESDNAQNEFYLTDIIKIGHDQNRSMGVVVGNNQEEIIGINSPDELKQAERILSKSNR